MKPQELLDLITAQMGKNEEDDIFSDSDSTHDSYSSGLLTDDDENEGNDELISEDNSDKVKAKSNQKIVHREWKKVARELIKEAEMEAKRAEEEAKKKGNFDDMI